MREKKGILPTTEPLPPPPPPALAQAARQWQMKLMLCAGGGGGGKRTVTVMCVCWCCCPPFPPPPPRLLAAPLQQHFLSQFSSHFYLPLPPPDGFEEAATSIAPNGYFRDRDDEPCCIFKKISSAFSRGKLPCVRLWWASFFLLLLWPCCKLLSLAARRKMGKGGEERGEGPFLPSSSLPLIPLYERKEGGEPTTGGFFAEGKFEEILFLSLLPPLSHGKM